MEIPHYQPFYLDTLDDLRAEIARLGLDLAIDENLTSLATPVSVGSLQVANRFCIQPMSGCDAGPLGAPSELTRRRYRRYAEGGAGLIWIESTAAGLHGKGPAQLALHAGTLEAFRSMIAEIRESATTRWQRDVVLILQLRAATLLPARVHQLPGGSEHLLTDDEIVSLRDAVVEASALAAEAGFDGVDVQACRGALAGTLLGAFTRDGAFGGSFENRTRFLREVVSEIRGQVPDLLVATKLCPYDAVRAPYGFGVDASDYRLEDLTEPVRVVQILRDAGLDVLNSNPATPNLSGPTPERALQPCSDGKPPDEHPLTVLDRQLRIAGALREAAPALPVVGTGFSWLRQFVPEVAAGAIGENAIDLVGLGRSALAYPDAPAAILERGHMDEGKSCMVCFACTQLRADGASVGCPIRDAETYGAEYQGVRRFAPERLREEAMRCHLCEAAPCIAASPNHSDIPAFIRAYRVGDESAAYAIIRRTDVLPETTAQLTPGWLHSEGACVESALTGRPIPILDLQYAVAWGARERGETAARLPETPSGKWVAVVGAGPTGIAASIRLLEHGHSVDLFDRTNFLGGVPERLIPASRFRGAAAEIEAILAPARAAGRLHFHGMTELRGILPHIELREATLLATGLWKERSLQGEDSRNDQIIDALTFLERVKNGTLKRVPDRVAVLAGGDSAMDAADTVVKLGAKEVFILFGGPRSAMHWHMPEDWFATPGVHAMMECGPIDYSTGDDGNLEGVRIFQTELDEEGILRVGMVIEAMGLEADDSLQSALPELAMTDADLVATSEGYRTNMEGIYAAGAIINGGASVARCMAEGLEAGEQIHLEIS